MSDFSTQSDRSSGLIFADVISECIETLQQAWNLSGYPTIVVATTDYPDQTAQKLTACFKHQIQFWVCVAMALTHSHVDTTIY